MICETLRTGWELRIKCDHMKTTTCFETFFNETSITDEGVKKKTHTHTHTHTHLLIKNKISTCST